MIYPTPPPTKISIEAHGIRFTAELPWDTNVNEAMEAFISLMIGQGYQIENIEDWIVAKSEEILEEDDKTSNNIV